MKKYQGKFRRSVATQEIQNDLASLGAS